MHVEFCSYFAGTALAHDPTTAAAAPSTAHQGTAATAAEQAKPLAFSKDVHEANAKAFTSWLQKVYPKVGGTHPSVPILLEKARRFVRRFHRENPDVVQKLHLTDTDISILHVYTLECEIYRRVWTVVLTFLCVSQPCVCVYVCMCEGKRTNRIPHLHTYSTCCMA